MELTFANDPSVPGIWQHPAPSAPAWLPGLGGKMLAGMVIICALTGCWLLSRLAVPRTAKAQQSAVLQMRSPTLPLPAASMRQPDPPLLPATAIPPQHLSTAQADTPHAGPRQTAAHTEPPVMTVQTGNISTLNGLAVSPDGKRMVTMSYDHSLVLWDVAGGKVLQRIPDIGGDKITFSQDGQRLLIINYQQTPQVWDLATGRALILPKGLTADGQFSADGRQYWEYKLVEREANNVQYTNNVYLYHSRYELDLRDLVSDKVVRTVTGMTGRLIAISRDNALAITLTGTPQFKGAAMLGTDDAEFIVWDLHSGKELTRLAGLPNHILPGMQMALSPDGKKFAAATSSPGDVPTEIVIWETHTGTTPGAPNKPILTIAGAEMQLPPSVMLQQLIFNDDGSRLASGDNNAKAVVWDAVTGKVICQFPHDDPQVKWLAFLPGGGQLITGAASIRSVTGPLRLWDVQTGKAIRSFTPAITPNDILTMAVSADGARVATSGQEHIVLWNLQHGCADNVLVLPKNTWACAMAFSPDGTTLLAALYTGHNEGEGSGMLQVWDIASGTMKKSWLAHGGAIDRVAFSPDGTFAVSCSIDRSIILWSTTDWHAEKRILDNPGRWVDEAAFSSDGMKLAWYCTMTKVTNGNALPDNGLLIVWDIPGGQRSTLDAGEGYYFHNLLFSPDGKWLTIYRDDVFATQHTKRSELILWNVLAGKEEKRLPVPEKYPWGIHVSAFTPDGTALLGYTSDGPVLWVLNSGEVRPLASGAKLLVSNLALAMRNTLLVTRDSKSNAFQLWNYRQFLTQPNPHPLATCSTYDHGRWLTITAKGYFNCSPDMASSIGWARGGQTYPYKQFAHEYHRPELVRKALAE